MCRNDRKFQSMLGFIDISSTSRVIYYPYLQSWGLYYYCDLTLPQACQPMAAFKWKLYQMKAVMPLSNRIATASDRSCNTGSWQRVLPLAPMKAPSPALRLGMSLQCHRWWVASRDCWPRRESLTLRTAVKLPPQGTGKQKLQLT